MIKIFKDNILNDKEKLDYFVIAGIDEINERLKNKYYQIVRDREFRGYNLPKDIIIVLAVKDRESLKT